MQNNEIRNITPKQYRTNFNTRRQNKWRVHEENHDWKEEYITISSETRLEKKVTVETEKINKLLPKK